MGNLIKKSELKNKIFFIKATLENNKKTKSPYRIIEIKGEDSLYDLAEMITNSFDFDFDHAFGFYNNLSDFGSSDEGYELFADVGEESTYPGVEKSYIYQVYTFLKKKFLFYFDYGDDWHFITELIEINEKVSKKKYPCICKKIGKSPEQYPEYDDE